MKTLRDFFPDKLEKRAEETCILSSRLPAFRIQAVDEERAARIRASAMRSHNQKGMNYREIDAEANMLGLVMACVVEPDLQNAELQAAWGVMGAESLLQKMLLPGEYAELSQAVSRICGFEEDMDKLVEQAKN